MKKKFLNLFKIKKILFLIFVLFIISIIVSQIKVYKRISRKNRVLSKFNYDANTGVFNEAAVKFYGGKTKLKHAVLLLHGYSCSPYYFRLLIEELKKNEIPYYAPLLTGFGQKDYRLLNQIKPEDWIRDALNAYDLLAGFFEEVSVLGHSNGGSLAVIIASQRPVKHLILTGPNINIAASDKYFKDILNIPVISSILKFYVPVFEKPFRPNRITNVDTLDTTAALESFHYSALPVNSLTALWELQDKADITKMKFENLAVMYGKYDLTVDMKMLLDALNKNSIKYQNIIISNSAHNIFEDYDKKYAVKITVDILKSNIPAKSNSEEKK